MMMNFNKLGLKLLSALFLVLSAFATQAQCPDYTFQVVATPSGFSVEATPSATSLGFYAGASIVLKAPTGFNAAGLTTSAGALGGVWGPNVYPDPACSPGSDYIVITGTALTPIPTTATGGQPFTLCTVDLAFPPCIGNISVAELSDPFVTTPGVCAGIPQTNRTPVISFVVPGVGSCVQNVAAGGSPVSCDPLSPLPVELLTFTATKLDFESILSWETASETNNDGFNVQRSPDGSKWETLGWVAGNGTTQRKMSYEFKDGAPLAGNNYYRLEQRDYDGQTNVSEIRHLIFGSGPKSVTVFPNPTYGRVVLDMPGYSNGEVQIRATDATGRVVFDLHNVDFSVTRKELDFSDLAPGVYQLNVRYPLGNETIPLMIVRD